jgi:paraquat-inducible protein A
MAGLVALGPAYFLPAMLVANALDGPRWYSVWGGIREFYGTGNHFLAGLIFVFSMVFPLVKLVLCLLCAGGQHWLPRGLRMRIVQVTSWSAKYSMLDVLVIAMAIMLVKVGEYVRIMPSMGLYLFSFAVLCSAVSGWLLERSLVREEAGRLPRRPDWRLAVLLLVPGVALAWWGGLRVL